MKGKRLIAALIIFLSIIFLPYWVYGPLILLAALAFPLFWEGIILGFFIDVFYGSIGFGLSSILHSFSFWILVLLLLLLPLRRIVRVYA